MTSLQLSMLLNIGSRANRGDYAAIVILLSSF